jgi:hypothetical protein
MIKVSQLISAGNMIANINSPGIDLQDIKGISLQAIYTGSPNGTLKVQVSNDIVDVGSSNDQASSVINWTDYPSSSVAISAAGSSIWNYDGFNYRWIRLVFTFSSGTGTLNVSFSGKG